MDNRNPIVAYNCLMSFLVLTEGLSKPEYGKLLLWITQNTHGQEPEEVKFLHAAHTFVKEMEDLRG